MNYKYKIGEQFILNFTVSASPRPRSSSKGVSAKQVNNGKLVKIIRYQNDYEFPYVVIGVNERLVTDIKDGEWGAREIDLIPDTKLHKALL